MYDDLYRKLFFKDILNTAFEKHKYPNTGIIELDYISYEDDNWISVSEKTDKMRDLNIDLVNCETEDDKKSIYDEIEKISKKRVEHDNYDGSVSIVPRKRVFKENYIDISVSDHTLGIRLVDEFDNILNNIFIDKCNDKGVVCEINHQNMFNEIMMHISKKKFFYKEDYVLYVNPKFLHESLRSLSNFFSDTIMLSNRGGKNYNFDILIMKRDNLIFNISDHRKIESMSNFDFSVSSHPTYIHRFSFFSGIINDSDVLFFKGSS